MEGVISRRPWAIIVIWLVVVAVASPLAASINSAVKTSQEQFLPSSAESVRADKALGELAGGNATRGSPDYLLVVSGVPVSFESYARLKPWYFGLGIRGNASLMSWIDIVASVEARMSEGYRRGVNGSVSLVEGLLGVAQTYNETLKAVSGLGALVNASDVVYDRYLDLRGAGRAVNATLQALDFSCNKALPAIAGAYLNVVRSEALLEAATDAYTNPPLGQDDIAVVVKYSNVTGLHPLDPGLIALVYNYTMSHGGPSGFNNTLAAELAGQAAWNLLASHGAPAEVKPYFDAALKTWIQLVSNDTDHRPLIKEAPSLEEGQLLLAQRIAGLESKAKPGIGQAVTGILASSMPQEAKPIVEAVGAAVVRANCTATPEVGENALARVLVEQGTPENIAARLAKAVVEGSLEKMEAARLAVETVATKANKTLDNATIEAIAKLIAEYDPDGKGLTASPYGLAGLLVAEKAGASLGNETLTALLHAKDPEEASLIVTQAILAGKPRGEKALGLLRLLAKAGLLGAPKSQILEKTPDLLAGLVASHAGNITVEQAKALGAAAVRVVSGEATVDEEARVLTNESLRRVFDNITSRLRGTLIEKDGNGFLVALEPKANTTEARVSIAREAKKEFVEGLNKLGYKAKVLLGGNEYMHYEMSEYAEKDIKKSDRLSMVFVIIILALIMESIAAVFLPFIGIGFGLMTSLAAAFVLAKAGVIDVTTHSRTIMFTTGLGLGIDYAAYVSRRFREAASKGLSSRDAAVEAYKASLRPVIAGATAAMIGFGSMLLAWDFPFISSIGADVPLTIFFVMIASLTFIPALLAYVGESRWFWWPRHPVETRREPRFLGAGRWSARHPWVLIGIAVVLAALAGVVMYGFQGSYNIALNLPPSSESRHAIDYINTHYDAGVLYPVTIVASSHDKAVEIAGKVSSLPCVSRASVEKGYQGRVVTVIMSVDPLSKEGVDCVAKIRSVAHSIDPGSLVGGMSAVNLDLYNLINDRFYHRVYPVAITLMFIVFLAVYGGLITAVSAILAVVIAAYAGSALTVLVYEKLLGTSVLWYLPVIVFTAILGVGMDYNSFYIARAREECIVECSREAVARSIALATPTVLGLATIMAGAYVGLALASSPGLSMMGTALVFGVLLAGFYASLLLTPPLIALLGRASWWPWKPGREGEA